MGSHLFRRSLRLYRGAGVQRGWLGSECLSTPCPHQLRPYIIMSDLTDWPDVCNKRCKFQVL